MGTPALRPSATETFSTFEMLPYWYIACKSEELGGTPKRVVLWDTPLVLFRDKKGDPVALLDRCAHRNVPLSLGRCVEGKLECGYHGWQFGSSGECLKIPALAEPGEGARRKVPAFPVREQQGYIWVYTDSESEPNHSPYHFGKIEDPDYMTFRYEAEFEGSLFAVAENILDVPHTSFLHRGLFRSEQTQEISTEVRRFGDRAECEFFGESRPSGLFGRLLAPGGGEVTHVDRFILPGVAQVEYGLGNRGHLVITSALSPVSPFVTRMYTAAVVRKSPLFSMVRPVAGPVVRKIVEQDARMIRAQTAAVTEFFGEHFAFSRADLLGPPILKLLKEATASPMQLYSGDAGEEPSYRSDGTLLT